VNSSGALWKIPSVIPFVIDIMNNVHSLPMNLPTDLTDIINSVGKKWHAIIFLFCFNFFSYGNSLGIYRRNISVSKIPRKFTDENIPSIFPFVFIDFLIMFRICRINRGAYKLAQTLTLIIIKKSLEKKL